MSNKIYTKMQHDEVEVNGKFKTDISMIIIKDGKVISKIFRADDGQKITIV